MTDSLPIMVAVDGTPANEAAIRFAAMRARRLDRQLTLVHVVPTWGFPRTHIPRSFQDLGHRVLQRATAAASKVYPADRITGELHAGPVPETLVAVSMHGHELIMGTDNPLARFEGGSFVVGVASTIPVPFIVVPADYRGPSKETGRIVAGLAEGHRLFIERAFQVARDEGMSLEFVRVQELPPRYASLFRTLPDRATWTQNAERQIHQEVQDVASGYPDVTFRTEVEWGDAVDLLVARTEGAELFLLERTSHHLRHIGRTARCLMQASHCPVEVVHVADDEDSGLRYPTDAHPGTLAS